MTWVRWERIPCKGQRVPRSSAAASAHQWRPCMFPLGRPGLFFSLDANHINIVTILFAIYSLIIISILACNRDLTTSMGIATSQLQIPAIPPANRVDQIESWVLKHFHQITQFVRKTIRRSTLQYHSINSMKEYFSRFLHKATEIIVSV